MSPDDRPRPAPDPRIEAAYAEPPEPDLDDPDNPEWTDEDFARAVGPEHMPIAELSAFPNTVAALQAEGKAPGGLVVLQLAPEVIAHFKARGPDWAERMAAALKAAAKV